MNMKRILAFQLSLLLLGLGFVGIIAFTALFGIQRQNVSAKVLLTYVLFMLHPLSEPLTSLLMARSC